MAEYKKREEAKFRSNLVKELKSIFPGCEVFHLNPLEKQGAPDLLILYKNKWACLEAKDNENAPHRPNQDYYVRKYNIMSFARFIYPENKEEILDRLKRYFRI